MRFAHVLDAVYRQPWNITAGGWLSLHEVLQSRLVRSEDDLDLSAFVNPRPALEIDSSGIAHISVVGALGKGLSKIEKACGNTGYEQIEEEIETALERGVRGLMLHIDSPGGACSGNGELAAIIGSLKIPTAAHTDTLCASAAYALAAGCDRVTAAPSAQVGSIGTILPLVDVSAAWEQRGWKPAYITHTGGDLKDATWPPSFTESHREHLQALVDEYFAQFRDHVLRFRAIEPDAMRGQTFLGNSAKTANLIDAVETEPRAYDALLRRVDKRYITNG